MGGNTPKGWKNGIFVPFFLFVYCVLSSLLCGMGVFVVQVSISFGWLRGGWGGVDRAGGRYSYARVYARSRTRSFDFCCHKCHSGWNWEYFIIPKTTYRFMESDVSFYRKQRVVLWKVTYRFMENNVSFYGKWRVVWVGGRKVVLRMVFWGFLGVE